MKVPIVFSADHNFIMPTGVAIYSLLKSANGTRYQIYVIVDKSVTNEDKKMLTKQVSAFDGTSSVDFITIGDEFKGSYEIRDISEAAYYRLLIPWLLPDLDKVIYSDGDIIFKGSLESLYNEDIEDFYVYGNGHREWKGVAGRRIKKLGLDPFNYTNSGFLVINSKAQREASLKECYMLHSKREYYFQDQDIINIVCQGKIKVFSSIYNCTPPVFKELSQNQYLNYEDIVVIHYAGDKPWRGFCPFWMEWWEAYRNSVFFDAGFYYQITAGISNPRQFFKTIMRKFINKYLK